MAKGKSTRKHNKLLSGRYNYFVGGGDLQPITMPTQAPGIDATALLQAGMPDKLQGLPTTPTGGGGGGNLMSGIMGAMGGPLGMINAAAGAVGTLGGQAIGGGLESGVGKGLNTVGNALGGVPLVGGILQGGFNLLGGLTNRMFGSKLNQENINKVNADVARANSARSDANSFDTLGELMASTADVSGFSKKFIGKDGWFSNKAKKKYQQLQAERADANARQDLALITNAEQLESEQLGALERNFAAYGGFLDYGTPIIDYDFMNRYLKTKEMSSMGQGEGIEGISNLFAQGGSIHIKPSKRGTFTAAAKKRGMDVQEFASKVLSNKEDYSPEMVKKANFARNAKKWHHAFGGELNTQGLDFTNGLLQINEGGSHEANPFEGVMVGVDSEGTPNLVEEGETIFNDYVFSNRMKVPKAIRDKYKLRGTKPITFAEASKKLAKESEERPNDPISQRGLEAALSDLAMAQEEKRARKEANQFAKGGMVNRFDDGGSYNMDPFMTALTGYTYSKTPGNVSGKYAIDKNLFGNDNPYMLGFSNITDLEGSDPYKNFTTAVTTNPNDYMDYLKALDAGTAPGVAKLFNGDNLVDNWADLFTARRNDQKGGIYHWTPEWQEATTGGTPDIVAGADGTPVPVEPDITAAAPTKQDRYYIKTDNGYELVEGENPLKSIMDQGRYDEVRRADNDLNGQDFYYDPRQDIYLGRNKAEGLRYAPAIGLGIMALTDALGLTNKPDFSDAAGLEAAARSGTWRPAKFRPVGQQLAYRPVDIDYATNKLNAEAGATRRAISQNAGLSRGQGIAGILAADTNYLSGLGDLAFNAENINFGRRQAVAEFNRQTDQINSQGFLQADIANQQAAAQSRGEYLRASMAAAQMRQQARMASDAAKSQNISGLFQALGDIGMEAKSDNMIRRLIESGALGPGAQRVYMDEKQRSEASKAERAAARAKKKEEQEARKAQRAAEKAARKQQKKDQKDAIRAMNTLNEMADEYALAHPGLFQGQARKSVIDAYRGQYRGRPVFGI